MLVVSVWTLCLLCCQAGCVTSLLDLDLEQRHWQSAVSKQLFKRASQTLLVHIMWHVARLRIMHCYARHDMLSVHGSLFGYIVHIAHLCHATLNIEIL
jgi:hypothetical protein